MYATKMKRCTRTVALITIAVLAGCSSVLVGCSSNDDADSTGEQVETQSTGTETAGTDTAGTETAETQTNDSGALVTKFDGTWRAECVEFRVFMVPEEDQPGGYAQRTLTIDSGTNTYSQRNLAYTDSQCTIADADDPTRAVSSGRITFDGIVTTSSGMEANVVRYVSSGSSPDLIGLLYRDGDVLYRDARESTLIEDEIPVKLNLSDPWQLVN